MAATLTRVSDEQVGSLDPYVFLAVLGKRVIHPGGRRSTEELVRLGAFEHGHRVLDVGCGVGATAIALARGTGSEVTAVDISPLMLERAHRNVARARLGGMVAVGFGDILDLKFPDGSFDRVIAEAVTMLVDRGRAARELFRVCRPGGLLLATEFYWRRPPTVEAREVFLGQVCPGMRIDSLDDWVRIYQEAGFSDIQVRCGPFEMMTPRGFLADEGLRGALRFAGRVLSRPAFLRKMAWFYPRMSRAVPYLGYILIAGRKPGGAAE